jgi:Na+/H+-dicarboxylate symporter
MTQSRFFKSYSFSILLICSIIIGSLLGICFGPRIKVIRPLGTIFLNLLFTVVVPMVFFSLSSAVSRMGDAKRLGRIMAAMLIIFIVTGIISSSLMVAAVKFYPPARGITLADMKPVTTEQVSVTDQIVSTLTVPDFRDLLTKRNMLAIIIFSILVGLATSALGPAAAPFRDFLQAGNKVISRVLWYIMLYAPIGLGAYFAYLVGVNGPELLGSYGRAVALYYPVAILYFVIAITVYVYLAAGRLGVKRFWSNILPTALTAWGTGSSIATIPTNLESAKRFGVPEDIRELVIPIGATIHMEGSCLAAVLKIALLFGLFGMPISGAGTILGMIGIALLSGTVISGIPAGGMIGELMIISLYHFPPEAMPLITMIGTLVDPPATMVNSVGDNVCSILVTRLLEGKNWLARQVSRTPAAEKQLVEV